MSIEQWWPKLTPTARDWLIQNNGDDLPAVVADQIVASGGAAEVGAPLPDDQIDWIEAVANDETPATD